MSTGSNPVTTAGTEPATGNTPVDWESLTGTETLTRVIEIPLEPLMAGDQRYNVIIRPNDVIHVAPLAAIQRPPDRAARLKAVSRASRAQAERGARGRGTGVYCDIHENSEVARNKVVPSAAALKAAST
jgi:hypothetical protein